MRLNGTKKMITISKSTILWFLILICYIESPYLARFQIIDIFYKLGKILSICFIIYKIRKVRFNFVVIIILLIEVSLWFSTLRTEGALITATNQMFSVVTFTIILDIMSRENIEKCIYVLYKIFSLLIYINVLSMILCPNGLYTVSGIVGTKKYYFLGQQNSMGLYSVIAIALGELRLKIEKNRKYKLSNLIFLEAVSIFYILRVWSVISLFSVAGVIIITTYNRISKKGWQLSLKWILLLNGLIFSFFVVGQNLYIFTNFFETFLHREMTLSGRTNIWAIAIEMFIKFPIFGMGIGKGYELFGFATTHNRYLNTLFTGGLVGFGFFVALLIWTCIKLKNSKENINKIFLAYFTIVLITIQGETFDDILFYLMFVLVDNVQLIKKQKTTSLLNKNRINMKEHFF